MSKTTKNWYCTCPGPLDLDNAPEGVERGIEAVGAKGKFWPVGSTIKIGFIGGTEAQKAKVRAVYAQWKLSANLEFTYPAGGPWDIRIAFQAGYGAWSYVGTDARYVQTGATMNLGFDQQGTYEHEAGHSLGLMHEQQLENGVCYNEANVIQDLSGPPNNWTVEQIRFNVLNYHKPADIITSGYDPTSIMHYPIPARWTCNGVAIPGGKAISAQDKAFISARYPGAIVPPITTDVAITAIQAAQLKAAINDLQTSANATKTKADGLKTLSNSLLGL